MKRIKYLRTMTWVFLMLMTLVLPWTIQKDVLGAEAEQGSITVRLDDLGTPMDNVKFTAYRVGKWSGEGKWVLEESLESTGVSFDNLTYADEWDAAALKLVQAGNFQTLDSASGQTDSSGTMTLSGLRWGMYLVEQNGESEYGTVSPFLAAIPYVQDGSRYSDLTVHPKAKAPEKEENGRIEVTKRTGFMDPELLEVIDLLPADAVYYVGIFQDKQGKVPYGTDYLKEIRMQGVSTGTAVFDKLPQGTYYIFETDSKGNAYKVDEVQDGDPYTWVCQLEDGSSQEITLDGKAETPAGKTGFYNLYYDLPSGYYYNGTVTVEKKVVHSGNQVTVSDTFYAGIFRDKAGKDLYQIVELVQNGKVTVDVPLGGATGEDPVTYYVYETDKNGKLLNKDSFGYTVSGEGKADIRQGNLDASVTITNTKKTSLTEESENSTEKATTASVRTGDETPIARYLVLFAAALAVLVVLISARYLKGRKKHG